MAEVGSALSADDGDKARSSILAGSPGGQRGGHDVMSLTSVQAIRRSIIAAGLIAYPFLAYYSTATPVASAHPMLGLTVALAPVLAMLAMLAWRSPRRLTMLGLYVVGCLLLWRFQDTLEQNFGWVCFIQHAGIFALLGVTFGITLTHGRRPLCTGLAEAVRGSLSREVARYTRHVTLAWSLFFLCVSLISTVLFLFSSMDLWSAFANFLTPVLVALMFVVEIVVRRRKLPDLEHRGIMDSIRAFRNRTAVGSGVSSHCR